MELTKAEKRAAREIIEKGLRKEMEDALLKLQELINTVFTLVWRNNIDEIEVLMDS